MELLPLSRNYFSPVSNREMTWRWMCWILVAVCTVILFLFWDSLRSTEFIASLVSFSLANKVVEYFFRAFTFLGDDEFFMILLPVIYWNLNKSLGFWTSVVLLVSALFTSDIPKAITKLPRPVVAGVETPLDYSFPSGHTSCAVTVWGYLAVMLRRRWFWIWTVVAVILIGFSRNMLGYHYLGDVLGGIAFGIVFLALFLWVSVLFYEKGWLEKFSFPLLLALSLLIPLALSFVPVVPATKLMGYLAGAGAGFVLEREKLGFSTRGKWYQHCLKGLLGVAVLFGIVAGLSSVLPSAVHMLGFLRYALAGFWVMFIAPLLFVNIGLASREVKQS